MAEDGITDYHLAKRKAARQLGLTEHVALPDHAEVETEFARLPTCIKARTCRDAAAMRHTAIELLELLADFNLLTGSVLDGTAGEHSHIDILLFADSAKEVEIFLLTATSTRAYRTRNERVEAVLVMERYSRRKPCYHAPISNGSV